MAEPVGIRRVTGRRLVIVGPSDAPAERLAIGGDTGPCRARQVVQYGVLARRGETPLSTIEKYGTLAFSMHACDFVGSASGGL
jgi:hypothetical protein